MIKWGLFQQYKIDLSFKTMKFTILTKGEKNDNLNWRKNTWQIPVPIYDKIQQTRTWGELLQPDKGHLQNTYRYQHV